LADHEGLTSPFHHELCPRGLWSSWSCEVCELGDVVNFHPSPVLAQFTATRLEP